MLEELSLRVRALTKARHGHGWVGYAEVAPAASHVLLCTRTQDLAFDETGVAEELVVRSRAEAPTLVPANLVLGGGAPEPRHRARRGRSGCQGGAHRREVRRERPLESLAGRYRSAPRACGLHERHDPRHHRRDARQQDRAVPTQLPCLATVEYSLQ